MILVETERLNIREAEEKDIEDIIRLETDPENSPYLWTDDYDGHLRYIDNRENILFIMEKKEDNATIGYALGELDFNSNVFNLRRIAISEKGKGYGRESMLGVFKYAFESTDTNRLWLDVYPFHQVGINLYESLNMNVDGVLRENYKDDRGYLDQIIYSILREEYMEIYK